MYGHFASETKQNIIKEIGKEFNFGFDVRSFYLIAADGEPRDWQRVREFVLK
jgi:hypothetical protein